MSNIINCFKLNNTIDISNNYYIFNNNNNVIGYTNNTIYGLYETSGNSFYSIQNIPKNYPIGFFDSLNKNKDISNLINYNVSYKNPIKIYVSKGSDISFNNNDYYRFYDESYNLLNINIVNPTIETTLTNNEDNFYFMRSMEYQFIAIEDFCSNHPFALSGEILTKSNYNNLILQKIDDSFNIIIPKETDNSNNKIFYLDGRQYDISVNLSILVDTDNISYYYGDISFAIGIDLSNQRNVKLSVTSYPFIDTTIIENIDLFTYNDQCFYIPMGSTGISSSLYLENIECLNIVSEASYNYLNKYYEFNVNNHTSHIQIPQDLKILKYGLYDGSYTIFNINPNFPFTIKNKDVSNNIYVDETNTTGIIHKSDSKIQSLGEPYNNYNYYFNTVRIIVNNNSTNFDVSLHVLNLENLQSNSHNSHYEINNTFIYIEACENSDIINSIEYRDLSFVLINQKGEQFTNNNNELLLRDNIYNLNYNSEYKELSIPYKAIDRYNHDISYLVNSNVPLDKNSINYDLSYFLISYVLEDYENNQKQLQRLVKITKGPFIEISGNFNIFNNSNPFTNIINISTNTNDLSKNFYKNIDVYLIDNCSNKIYLPYEITFTGTYYQAINKPLVDTSGDILKYTNNNILRLNGLNYYLSKNIQFEEVKQGNNNSSIIIDNFGFKIININNIEISNFNSQILEEYNLIYINNDITASYKNFLESNSIGKIKEIALDGFDASGDNPAVFINKINNNNVNNNNLAIIDLSQNLDKTSSINNIEYKLYTVIEINNLNFNIIITDTDNSFNNISISGSFDPIHFFDINNRNNIINTKNLGDYNINVKVLGLNYNDFILNDLTNNNRIDVNNFILDLSRTFFIKIDDRINPELNFINNDNKTLYYDYKYSKDFSFNILSDINFFKKGDLYIENTNKPLLEFSDNSIYDGSLSFKIDNLNNIKKDNLNNLTIDNFSNDASASIIYNATDLCGNRSNDVSLNIRFTNIPLLTLLGSPIKKITLYSEYNEPGLSIKSNLGNGIVDVSYIPAGPYLDNFSSNFSTNRNTKPTGYDISWSLNLDISNLGINELTYEVRKTGYIDSIYVKRFIEVIDISNPFFRFPDLSNIAYIDGLNIVYIDGTDDTSFTEIKNTLKNNTSDNSFNIDFSFTVFSSFDDLSFIINTFEVSDNYFSDLSLSTIITLSISGENDKLFNRTTLLNNGYLNTTDHLNKLQSLKLNYKVIDVCDNSFNISRLVNIVDVTKPLIDFSFDYTNNLLNTNYVYFDNNYIDFSYQAINYVKDLSSLIIEELSSIIFNFTLIDNYEINNSNYLITISGNNYKKDNIKTIEEISNDISLLDLFSKVDTSLVIIYEISDNQFNYNSINRNVNIINTIKPSIKYLQNTLNISFGDISFNILSDFSLNHSRLLLNSDISLNLNFILPDEITSILGTEGILYDSSALIYSYISDLSNKTYDISFFSVDQKNLGISSDILNIKTIVNNSGPNFSNVSDISFEAGEYISDASLILGINAESKFDSFYYYNNFQDISYLFTNFNIKLPNDLDLNIPKVGKYTISYEAIDQNNQSKIISRILDVKDNKPPIISISGNISNIDINNLQDLTIPSAYFLDKGSDLSSIQIDFIDKSNNLLFVTNNVTDLNKSYNYISTQQYNISYLQSNDISGIKYSAVDIYNNSNEKLLSINLLINDFIITPQLIINGKSIDLNNNFNTQFTNLINNRVNNLSSIFDVTDIQYNTSNKTITYEMKKIQFFTLLDFSMVSTYKGESINHDNNTVTHNILGLVPGKYKILFQAFENINFNSLVEVIDFNIIDTKPPIISFIPSLDYSDILNIKLPLLSSNTYDILRTNINYFENNNLNNPNIFCKNIDGNIIYSIPGINIDDIIVGNIISLSNETLLSQYDTSLSLYISYSKDSSNVLNTELLQISGDYIQNYRVYDVLGNFSDISRNIKVEKFDNPFINLNYHRDDNNNIYLKSYHIQFTAYIDLLGRVYNYYIGEILDKSIKITQVLNENKLGLQKIKYELENNSLVTVERDVQVVNSKCLENINDISNIFAYAKNGINYKYGLYKNTYQIKNISESNAIRIYGSNNYNISNLINITGDISKNYDNNKYYYGNINLNVIGNFNRANIEYLNGDLSKIILEDFLLYNEKCNPIRITPLLRDSSYNKIFIVDVSKSKIDPIKNVFILLDNSYNLLSSNLHLSVGKYKFNQNSHKNFYNRIKFSLKEDGTHNGGKEYTKGITEYNLSAMGGYTEIVISATTPSPLYYYSEHFPNMGGKIETKNNLIIANSNLYVNDNILTIDNSNVLVNKLQGSVNNNSLLNRIFLSQKFDCSGINGNEIINNNLHFNCLTQQNINHNVLLNKNKNLIIFKKYQASSSSNIDLDIPNNIKHDISNNYLFDFSVNQFQSNIFQYNYTIDTSINILQNLSTNISRQELAVAVGSGNNTITYSLDGGLNWIPSNNKLLDISGLGIAYNGSSRFIAVGSGNENYIVYSDNGINWYSTLNSKTLFDNYAKAVVYDTSNSLWLVGGSGNSNNLAYSTNGINWNILYNNIFNIQVNGFSKHNNKYILALGNGVDHKIAYSSNGTTWYNALDSSGNFTSSIFSIQANSAVYYKKKNIWLAVGEGGDSIASSVDGEIWVGLDISNSIITEGRDIDANDNIVIVVGKGNNSIIYSYDAITWTPILNNIFKECNSIVWTGTRWLATGLTEINENLKKNLAVSNNGLVWSIIDNNVFFDVGYGIEGFTRNSILKNANNILYEMDTFDLFLNNNEIHNYSNLFINNKLLSINYLPNNFISKINELKYVNNVQLIENDKIYDYFMNKYLNSNRIIFSNIFDNLITFNLQIYVDLENININKNLLDFLRNEYMPLLNRNTNYTVDNNNLLLDEYMVNIWSDIFGQPEVIKKTPQESIVFSNGLIELSEYLLDSKDSSNILFKLYDDVLNVKGINYIDNELKEKVFFSVRDSSMTNHDYCQYIGFTLQNIYHNMYIDESNILIFHSYQDTVNNFKVNEPSLTLEKTLLDFSNNNQKYLLEISLNDIYACFVDPNDTNISQEFTTIITNEKITHAKTINNSQEFTNIITNEISGVLTSNISYLHVVSPTNPDVLFETNVSVTGISFETLSNATKTTIIQNVKNLYARQLNINDDSLLVTLSSDNTNIYENYNNISLSSNTNIYENSNKKNNIIEENSLNYKSFIVYFFDNELPNNSKYLTEFEIISKSRNNISYDLYPYSYDASLQTFHSHTYLIDLNEYFDRYIYDNSNLEVPYNIYNKSNLIYNLKNITYINDFSLIDVAAEKSKQIIDISNIKNKNSNHILSSSELLINSYKSNNIKIKFDISYNSYLYPNKYVDTIVLDIAIPDYTPPTLIFNNDISYITISQILSTSLEDGINTLLNELINDISFVEINQQYEEISSNLTNIIYNDINNVSLQDNLFSKLENNIYSTIEIDIRNLNNNTTEFNDLSGYSGLIDIFYTVTDNANNKNILTRKVNVLKAFSYPEFYINGVKYQDIILSQGEWTLEVEIGTNITTEMLKQGVVAIDIASNNELLEFDVSKSNLIDINVINIYKDAVIYTAISKKGISNIAYAKRTIKIIEKKPIINVIDNNEISQKNCPCPVFYKPLQHNYKLGSGASRVMQLSRIILKNR